jgi:hypothetical protein
LDMILHKFVHMFANFHITLIVRKHVAEPNEKLYTNTQFVPVAYKIFNNWSSNPYSPTQR